MVNQQTAFNDSVLKAIIKISKLRLVSRGMIVALLCVPLGHCHVLHAMVSQMRVCRLSLHVMVSGN